MDPLLKGYFERFIESHEIEKPQGVEIDDADKMSTLYERFINYILFSVDDPEAFTADSELLEFVSSGGEDDSKLDGFGIIVQGRLVRSRDDIQHIIETVKKIDVEFVAIQTKMRTRFNNTEFLAFGTMLRKFFSSTPPPLNEGLKELYDLKNYIFNESKVRQALQSNPKLTVYYAFAGQFKPDKNYSSTKETILSTFSDEDSKGDYLENVNIEIIDARKTREKFELIENNYDVTLNINKSMNLTVGNNDKIKKAVSFTCTGKEFLKLLTHEDGSLRRSLFNDNVRDYLGSGNVNREIESTMIEEPELFLLCNNGVTIVSSNFEPIKDDLVKIVNPQIVNGCQTSNTLFKLRDKVDTDKLMLSVRVICTDDNDISNKVVRSTNRQNQVLEEAFEATKPFHQKLEKIFSVTSSPVKLYYERRARQYTHDATVPKAHIVNLRVLTHVFVAAILGYPNNAHRHEAKLLEMYGRNNRRIFRDDHDTQIYYLCALLYYRIEEAFKTDRSLKVFSKLRGHLYYIIRMLVSRKVPILAETNKDYQKFTRKLRESLSEVQTFSTMLNQATLILMSAQEKWIKEGKSPFGIKDNSDFTRLLTTEINHAGNLNTDKPSKRPFPPSLKNNIKGTPMKRNIK